MVPTAEVRVRRRHMGTGTEKRAAEASSPASRRTSSLPRATTGPPPQDGSVRRRDHARQIPQRKGDPIASTPTRASGPTRPSRASPGSCPAFAKDGTITAGNASQISDGAPRWWSCPRPTPSDGCNRWPSSSATAWWPGPTACLLDQPSARSQALDKAGIAVGDLDLFELNEAFAAVGLASMADLGITGESSTSTAGRSRSATRWACGAPGS